MRHPERFHLRGPQIEALLVSTGNTINDGDDEDEADEDMTEGKDDEKDEDMKEGKDDEKDEDMKEETNSLNESFNGLARFKKLANIK